MTCLGLESLNLAMFKCVMLKVDKMKISAGYEMKKNAKHIREELESYVPKLPLKSAAIKQLTRAEKELFLYISTMGLK